MPAAAFDLQGHRGARGLAPENTLAAFRTALDLSSLPGGLPPLASVKLLPYDEEAWTAKRKETLERIKDVLQESR